MRTRRRGSRSTRTSPASPCDCPRRSRRRPAEPTNLKVEIEFPEDGGLDLHGNFGSSRRFAVQFDPASGGDSTFEFRRAALRFGGGEPEFRTENGITFDGSVGALDIDAWLALPTVPSVSGAATNDWAGAFAGAELESTDLTAFAQKLGATKVSARRRTDDWQIDSTAGRSRARCSCPSTSRRSRKSLPS